MSDRLPAWMRIAMFATAVMNLAAGIAFLPFATDLRAMAGLPPGEQPIYLATVALFVLLFGAGYLWTAVSGRGERLFITIAAVGKLAFVTLVVWYCLFGALPLRAPLVASGDLLFGLLFVHWLRTSAPG